MRDGCRRTVRTLGLAWLALLLGLPTAGAQAAPDGGQPAPRSTPPAVEVSIDLLIVRVGNYDSTRATYTLDLYLGTSWNVSQAPEGFHPSLDFLNGHTSEREVVTDQMHGSRRSVWEHVEANLYARPFFRDFPFDHHFLEVVVEDTRHPESQLRFLSGLSTEGVHKDVRIGGWDIVGMAAAVTTEDYPFREPHSRFTYALEVERPRTGAFFRTLLPPLTFALVAGVAFVLRPDQLGSRVGLGTGTLIAAVGHHVSQTVALPALPRLTLLDAVMMSTYAYIAVSLAVTTVLSAEEKHAPELHHTAIINWGGAALSALVAFVVFAALRFT